MKKHLIEELFRTYGFENQQGFKNTPLDHVKLMQIDHHEQTKPLLYNRGIILIASGQKTGYIDNEQITLSSDNFLVIATVQPVECETFIFDKVMRGLYIDLDMQRLQKITNMLDTKVPAQHHETPTNIVTGHINEAIDSVFTRLMKLLLNAQDAKVLGEHILDELYYRIIQCVKGEHLIQLCCQNTHFSRISNIVDTMQNRLDTGITIDDMAAMAHMSKANFHKKFKEIFNDSPIQYIKKIRLNKARQYILYDKMKIVDAASKVGYESPAQFSREFKSHFGITPSDLKKKAPAR